MNEIVKTEILAGINEIVKGEKLGESNEIVKEKWRLLLVEQNSSKQLSQKKTLKNQNKPRKKLQNKSFLWDFGYGICWNLRIWQFFVELQNADTEGQTHDDDSEQGQIHDDWLYVLPRGIFKKAKAAGW